MNDLLTAILGLSAFYHDSAAALLVDGEIVAAAQEERFTRKKQDECFPAHAIEYCLSHAGIHAADLDYVGFYEKPFLKFDRLLHTYLAYAPRGFWSFSRAIPQWLQQKIILPRVLRRGLGGAYRKRFVFTEHHESHAASAFYPSPFEEAAILTIDGVGEWATACIGIGQAEHLHLKQQLRFPHSLGMLYSAVTYYCGFKVNSGEYKLMGLAPYGEPTEVDNIRRHLLDLKPDGSFRLDMSYFNYCQGLTMTSSKFHRLFGGPPRQPEAEITQREMNLAASIQRVTEEIVLKMAEHARQITGMKNLCLAGGVALNCVANGRLLREGPFENLWIQPASGDAGGSLGTALFIWHQLLKHSRSVKPCDTPAEVALGPIATEHEVVQFLKQQEASFEIAHSSEDLCERVAQAIAAGNVVGWMQGRMEFGPRALGNRSLLADPRNPEMQRQMNLKIKFRESFRPFAPAVKQEQARKYFDIPPHQESPYMLLVAPVQPSQLHTLETPGLSGFDLLNQRRSQIPAVTHVDNSARVQTVSSLQNPLFHQLLSEFEKQTGCPVLINTSFNIRGEPIVCTPADAFRCFMGTDIDLLVIGNVLVKKSEQLQHKSFDHSSYFSAHVLD